MQWVFVAAYLAGLQAINDFTHYTSFRKSHLVKWDLFNKLLFMVLILPGVWKFVPKTLPSFNTECDATSNKEAIVRFWMTSLWGSLGWLCMCAVSCVFVFVHFCFCLFCFCFSNRLLIFFFLLEIEWINPCRYLLTFKNPFESASDLSVFCFPWIVKKTTEK